MRTKTTFTKDYVLLCETSGLIQVGDLVFQQNFEKTNTQIIKIESEFQKEIANDRDGSFTKFKILAYRKLNPQAHDLDGLPLFPDWNEEVEDLFNKVDDKKVRYSTEESDLWIAYKHGFYDAYEELSNDKLFTLEDILDAWEIGAKEGLPLTRKNKEELLQQLQQSKLPKEFVPAYIDTNSFGSEVLTGSYDSGNFILKTIDTTQGIQVVGKWIF